MIEWDFGRPKPDSGHSFCALFGREDGSGGRFDQVVMGDDGLDVCSEEIASGEDDSSRKRSGALGLGGSGISDDFARVGRVWVRESGIGYGINQDGDGEKR